MNYPEFCSWDCTCDSDVLGRCVIPAHRGFDPPAIEYPDSYRDLNERCRQWRAAALLLLIVAIALVTALVFVSAFFFVSSGYANQ